jgi:hypothetical protein
MYRLEKPLGIELPTLDNQYDNDNVLISLVISLVTY